MTAQIWINFATPWAQLWGLSPEAMAFLLGFAFILVATVGMLKVVNWNKSLALPFFLGFSFLGTLVGIMDWIVFIVLLILSGAVHMSFKGAS